FRRHVRGEIPDDLDGDGRGQMRVRGRDGGGLHRLERFELPDADSGRAGSPGQPHENDSPGGSAGPGMKSVGKRFRQQAARMTHDLRHRRLIQIALAKYEIQRDRRKAAFRDWEAARQLAAETKWDAVNHLDRYL